MHVCASASSVQRSSGAGTLAKKQRKAKESSRTERQPVLAGKYISQKSWHKHDRAVKIFFSVPVDIS